MIITGIFFICFAVLSFAGDDFRLLNYSFREDSTKSEYKRDGWYGYLYDLYTDNCSGILVRLNDRRHFVANTFQVPEHKKLRISYKLLTSDVNYLTMDVFFDGKLAKEHKSEHVLGGTRTVHNCQEEKGRHYIEDNIVIDHSCDAFTVRFQATDNNDYKLWLLYDFKIEYDLSQECVDNRDLLIGKYEYEDLDDGEEEDGEEQEDDDGEQEEEKKILYENSCGVSENDSGEYLMQFKGSFLKPYVFNDDCFDLKVFFQDRELDSDGLWEFSAENQEITWNIKLDDLVEVYECDDLSFNGKEFWECSYRVQVLHDGDNVKVEFKQNVIFIQDQKTKKFSVRKEEMEVGIP